MEFKSVQSIGNNTFNQVLQSPCFDRMKWFVKRKSLLIKQEVSLYVQFNTQNKISVATIAKIEHTVIEYTSI